MQAALKEEEKNHYTYADYLEWDTDERYEIIDGEAYMMSAPTVSHQTISGELFGQVWNFLRDKPCRVFAAPLDVRLFPEEDQRDDTVVQPDIVVVCDESKLADNRSCRGAPDLVIEILSPSNTGSLMFLKFQKYLQAGVREYWVVNPETGEVQVHVLDEERPGRYISTAYDAAKTIDAAVLPGLKIDFTGIWSAL
ncbi:MAG: Uma2 family endonuclease [Treponema sp.]|jgi:Uma2 family endonuclease|nr:Uma2 family endonuclease [Treponema sp.]